MFDLEAIKTEMRFWRMGLGSIPSDYIAIHQMAAMDSLADFCTRFKLTPLKHELVSDGWCDGMKVVEVRVYNQEKDTLETYRWSDSNGGSWFNRQSAGGQSLVEVSEYGPGYM